MYILVSERFLGQGSDEEAATSAATLQGAAQESYAKYQSDCKGIRILKRLTRNQLNPLDEATLLRKRIAELPQLFRDKAELDRRTRLWRGTRVFADPAAERRRIEEFVRRTGALSPEAYRMELARLLVRLGYPPNYVLRDLDTELAQAKCELSQSNWRLQAPCSGMEEDNPQYISRQVAEQYVRREFGLVLKSQKTSCSPGGRLCDVDFANGMTIRVAFGKIPSALIARQVAPKLGPRREYSYSCLWRNVILSSEPVSESDAYQWPRQATFKPE